MSTQFWGIEIGYTTKITALYSRLSVGVEDRDGGESNSIVNQRHFRAICKTAQVDEYPPLYQR